LFVAVVNAGQERPPDAWKKQTASAKKSRPREQRKKSPDDQAGRFKELDSRLTDKAPEREQIADDTWRAACEGRRASLLVVVGPRM